MATVISVCNWARCVRRCDARCHNAKGPACKCICGGALHGIGSRAAMEKRFDLTDKEILENCRELTIWGELHVKRSEQQPEMFV